MKEIKIIGLHCQHCVKAAKEALEELGLTDVQVDLESGKATFAAPAAAVTREQIADAIDDAGFDVDFPD